MILPSKHIPEEQSLLGIAGEVLRRLERPQTVSGLWEGLRDERVVGNYRRFVLALDLLYIIGMVSMSESMIRKEMP